MEHVITLQKSQKGELGETKIFVSQCHITKTASLTTLALGGTVDGTRALGTVEEWNPETNTWSNVLPQLKSKTMASGVAG